MRSLAGTDKHVIVTVNNGLTAFKQVRVFVVIVFEMDLHNILITQGYKFIKALSNCDCDETISAVCMVSYV